MRTVSGMRHQSLLSISLLTFILVLLLAACVSNTNTGTGSSTSATPSPTQVKGYGTANGCPRDMVLAGAPTKANVIIKPSNSSSTIVVHDGDVIEVDLPFGHRWDGPTISQGVLELQQPAGYAWKATNTCVWRFIAKGTGTSQLNFTGRALCKIGQMCPMYVLDMPFTIQVK
jgi:hypothetical protein